MLEVSQLLQVFFLSAAATLLPVNSIPALRYRYVTYGSRATPAPESKTNVSIGETEKHTQNPGSADKGSKGLLERVLDSIAALQVPHGYFRHFYIISVFSSLFWAAQFFIKGRILQFLCQYSRSSSPAKSMTIDQVILTWSLLSIQGVRRLFESYMFAKPSTSRMWFVHWLVGIAYYLSVGIAVWIEGAGALLCTESPVSNITWSAPSLKTMLSIPIFLLASGIQHDCHKYLASLPKYSLPMHPIFQVLICPHYTTECLIYVSLAILSAPRGSIVNKTVFAALIFVATNLATTASMSKEWYAQKFGREAVARRWKMIPMVY